MESGEAHAKLSFSKTPTLTLTLRDAGGNEVGSATGKGVLTLLKAVSAGTYTYEVGGSNRGSFTLTVTTTVP